MFKILVLGSSGQLGSCLRDQKFNYDHEYIFFNREHINIRNLDNVKKKITCKKLRKTAGPRLKILPTSRGTRTA